MDNIKEIRFWIDKVNAINETYSKDSFFIKEYTPENNDWEYILNNKEKIWIFLNEGYKMAGYERFCGCDNVRSLIKNANLIKIASVQDEWVAISIYTGYIGGYKNVGITATSNNELRNQGILAVHKIIKTDIGNFKEFFWSECSGAVEHLYEKYKGIKIPNEYVFSILFKKVSLDPDGFHYEREIKGEKQRKIIYGFNNKETFEIVLKEREDYIKNCINDILSMQINESFEKPSFGHLNKLDCAIAIVNFFVDQRWEGECYDFPLESLKLLKNYIEVIKTEIKNNLISDEKLKIAINAIENGTDVLETSCVMQVYSF